VSQTKRETRPKGLNSTSAGLCHPKADWNAKPLKISDLRSTQALKHQLGSPLWERITKKNRTGKGWCASSIILHQFYPVGSPGKPRKPSESRRRIDHLFGLRVEGETLPMCEVAQVLRRSPADASGTPGRRRSITNSEVV